MHVEKQKVSARNPVFVFHGGPGLDSSYLASSLGKLSLPRKLVFFNQLGSAGEDRAHIGAINAETILEHAHKFITQTAGEKEFGVLAHSWGSWLALQYIERYHPKVCDVVLTNPLPLTWDRLMNMGGRFQNRLDRLLTKDQLEEKSRLMAIGDASIGPEYMKLIAPLYVGPGFDASRLKFDFYDPRIGNSVIGSIYGFDSRTALRFLPEKTLVILGGEDFFSSEDVAELINSAKNVVTLNTGHSPFVENPTDFERVLNEFYSG